MFYLHCPFYDLIPLSPTPTSSVPAALIKFKQDNLFAHVPETLKNIILS